MSEITTIRARRKDVEVLKLTATALGFPTIISFVMWMYRQAMGVDPEELWKKMASMSLEERIELIKSIAKNKRPPRGL